MPNDFEKAKDTIKDGVKKVKQGLSSDWNGMYFHTDSTLVQILAVLVGGPCLTLIVVMALLVGTLAAGAMLIRYTWAAWALVAIGVLFYQLGWFPFS